MADDPPPRRRIADRDRRRWSDDRLDDNRDTVERRLDALERFQAVIAQVPGLMQGLEDSVERLDKDVRELRQENRLQHKRVAYGVDPEDGKTPLPQRPVTLTWGAVAKIATILAAFFGPTAALVAALLGAG